MVTELYQLNRMKLKKIKIIVITIQKKKTYFTD